MLHAMATERPTMPPSPELEETALAVSRRVGEHVAKARASGQHPSVLRACSIGRYAFNGGNVDDIDV